ncbi:WD repeat-containing protein on Y chromosome-like [Scomber scombrus]|uniref:WD repeat-containing protein on Y chromosome-like n=1 Tax=Scomber scombrus TaxID=13677 RepID=UPI002DD90F1B|nr:WD repeat-containing protein on Y chromosome-like [Scomber scombrus]
METQTETAQDPPEDAAMETKDDEPIDIKNMFTCEDIPLIVQLFREADADGSGGLDTDEFCVALQQFYGAVNTEDLIALHMQIDVNCDGTVDLDELLNFVLTKNTATANINLSKHTFPKTINVVPVDHYKSIVKMIFRPFEDSSKQTGGSELSVAPIRPYQKGQYLSVSSDGLFSFWSDSFHQSCPVRLNKVQTKLPFSHRSKMYVNDMVYIRELKEVAIATYDRELTFFTCNEFPDLFQHKYSLIFEENIVNTMNYWSNGTKAVFSFGDTKGFLFVFVSNNIKSKGLFCKNAFEKITLREYPTVYVSSLLKNSSEDFLCIKIPIFDEICHQVQYFQSLDSFAICGSSFTTMVLIPLPKSPKAKINKKLFKSCKGHGFFTCIEYCPSIKYLVTGGTDGALRGWYPHDTVCKKIATGHIKPISCITVNVRNKILHSISVDKNLRLWCEESWACLQSIQVELLTQAPISTVCYNLHNNELVLANTDMGTFLGRGTDLFISMLTSHDQPLCGALYHSIFKQVISVCLSGVVIVWDILTGTDIVKFKVTPDHYIGFTAFSFDGTQRRLITVSDQGKVRLWNFSNGAELSALPVTVQKEVTGIVSINDRVFVSGWNSKVIFDLDLEEVDNRVLEHDHLSDISSMSAHEARLFTASSNGNIVIWDAETAEVTYWLDTTTDPRTHMADRKTQGYIKSAPESQQKKPTGKGPEHKDATALTDERNDMNTCLFILCLQTRTPTANTATLLTSENNCICAWSIISTGGLLGKFRAVLGEGDVITTMSTDSKETILLTGSSTGKVYLWDIQSFGFRKKEDPQGPFEVIKNWQVSLYQPHLLGSWRAHEMKVMSVKCDSTCEKIITASLDSNVTLWTNTGQCIGIFGKHEWDAEQISLIENTGKEEALEPDTETKESSQNKFIVVTSLSELGERLPSGSTGLSFPEAEDDGSRGIMQTLLEGLVPYQIGVLDIFNAASQDHCCCDILAIFQFSSGGSGILESYQAGEFRSSE